MNLAGIPPFSGFLGKIALLQAGVEAGDPLALLGVGAAVATSLLTLYAIAKTWNRAFWQPIEDGESTRPCRSTRPRWAGPCTGGPASAP